MTMQMEMEDMRAAQLPLAPRLVNIESAALGTDFKFALRHFLDDARSEPSPSMQVSFVCDSNSLMVSTMYHTALTHFDEPIDLAPACIGMSHEIARANGTFESTSGMTQLTIHGSPGSTPLYFAIDLDCSVRHLKKLIAGRLELLNPNPQDFRLRYEGRILPDDYRLRSCGTHPRAFLDYEAMGLQFQRFTNLPDIHPSPDIRKTTRILSFSKPKSKRSSHTQTGTYVGTYFEEML